MKWQIIRIGPAVRAVGPFLFPGHERISCAIIVRVMRLWKGRVSIWNVSR
ncbi:hypothetical protein CLOBOL_07219 [Enterocloster bolteae ATCC BAA-613]|uniref:Uncharacterized protein n=1 Tax=Enterocloster bolteae (strain ATCC BAA-613 / DSM 15670 / CCUG 46953 / JCM 12243 / WAL 16351) TaxID=411902 RepID=A8S5I5_ENTBW|nr:hypothetical protein CLOBOL_07219 [Enterocloster bolteae ATCC BAA-613]